MTDVGRVTQASALAFYIAGPDPNREVAYLDHVARWQDDEVEILTEPARFSLDAAPVLSQFPHVRAPLVLRDILSDSQLPEDLRKEFAARNVTSLLLLPVTAGSVWLGTVIGEKSRPGGFDDEAVRLASSIAEQTGMALNLQLMLEHNRQTALRERVIRQVIDRIRVSTDPDEVTAIADQSLSELLSVPVETIHEARLGNRNLLSPEDWQIIRDIDHQAQLTISNLFLLERTQRTVMTEQVVSDITAELQRTSDVDEVLETTVRALRAALADYDISLRLEPGLVDSRGADSDGDH
jgi:GAF domain-containing protein